MTVIAVLLGTSACIDTPPMGEPPEIEQSRVEIKEMPPRPVAKHDVLIVIDDSVATEAYRERFAELPSLVTRGIQRFAGSWSDTHIAVVTSDGTLRRVPGSGAPYLSDSRDYDFTNQTNYTGTLAAMLGAMMGTTVPRDGASQPLEAMRHALETAGDFMRDDAKLTIVLVSASDDASPFPVADYAAWTQRLESSWQRGVVIAAIYPAAAPRLDEYVHAIPHRAFPYPIDGDLQPALIALELDWGGWGFGCTEGDVMRKAEGAGDQYDCAMSAQIGGELRSVSQCETRTSTSRVDEQTDAPPTSACWELLQDRQSCTAGSGLTLRLHGYTGAHHPAFRFECRTR